MQVNFSHVHIICTYHYFRHSDLSELSPFTLSGTLADTSESI